MKSYTYTAFDGHPDGSPIPALTDRRIKALDTCTALVKAQDSTDRYVKSCCEPATEPRRYWVVVKSNGAQVAIGFVDVAKGQASRWSAPQYF